MNKNILVRPIVTEKSTILNEKQNRYAFVVDKNANKIEIKKAVEEMYGVSVVSVNTLVMPAKNKTKFTKKGQIHSRKGSYKKAYISLAQGDNIDFYEYTDRTDEVNNPQQEDNFGEE